MEDILIEMDYNLLTSTVTGQSPQNNICIIVFATKSLNLKILLKIYVISG